MNMFKDVIDSLKGAVAHSQNRTLDKERQNLEDENVRVRAAYHQAMDSLSVAISNVEGARGELASSQVYRLSLTNEIEAKDREIKRLTFTLTEAQKDLELTKVHALTAIDEERCRATSEIERVKELSEIQVESKAQLVAAALIKDEKAKRKQAEKAAQEAEVKCAALEAKNEMLEKMIDLGGSMEDVKGVINQLFEKLPTVDLKNLTLNTTVETVAKECPKSPKRD